ncbi:hypothetical protein C2E31_21650, partial [Rhodopirellula baltica]
MQANVHPIVEAAKMQISNAHTASRQAFRHSIQAKNATFAERKATLAISEHYRPHWSQAGAIEFWPKAIRTIGWGIA